MKVSPSKGSKAGGKKRSRSESEGSAQESPPPTSPPHPNPAKEWKKSKLKTEDLLPLVNSGFLQEKEMDLWRLLGVFEISDETPEHELEESQNVQVHR
jgi:hypothetical protein